MLRDVKMRRNKVNVFPKGDEWVVKREGCERAYRIVPSQQEAVQLGTHVAIKHKCELWVYRPDGSIKSKDSFGVDSFPQRN